MKKWNENNAGRRSRINGSVWNRATGRRGIMTVRSMLAAVSMIAVLAMAGCGSGAEEAAEGAAQPGISETGGTEATADGNRTVQAEPVEIGGTGIGTLRMDTDTDDKAGEYSRIADESARDAQVDFDALKAENPEIFAWLYIPETSIDVPVLQSGESDDYYETHNVMKEEDDGGALYIEAANLTSMCDFNTVIHGRTGEDGESGIFADLHRFADPDYFDSHEQMYLYLEDNVLTYEIFAAYERENTSLIRTYDFTWISGCEQFLKDMYNTRSMNMMIRSGWEDVTPYHFLVTLTTCRGDNPEKQFVVLAALIEDPAGTIDRAVPAE